MDLQFHDDPTCQDSQSPIWYFNIALQFDSTGCCIELVLFHWGVWQQKFLLQPTPLFCDSLVRGSFFALLLVLVLLTQSDPLSCWCRVNEMTPFVGKNCKRSWSMRYPSFAVWQHLFLASRRIVGYGKWKMCENPREIMQKVRIWSRIRMCQSVWLLCDPVQHATCVLPAEPVQHAVFLFCLRDLSCVWRERCYWLHLLLFPFERTIGVMLCSFCLALHLQNTMLLHEGS